MKKRKIICVIVCAAMTVLYIWLIGDSGRHMGVKANDAVEDYGTLLYETKIKEREATIEDSADLIVSGSTDSWRYNTYDNLEELYKTDMIQIAGVTAIYFVVLLVCYHLSFHKKDTTTK